MSSTITNGNFTLTIDDLTWGETITAGTTLATITIENPNGLNYFEFYGYNAESWDLSDKINFVNGSDTYVGGADFSGETSVTLQLVANQDLNLTTLDELNLYIYSAGGDWAEEGTLDFNVAVNEAPENIALSADTISEDATLNTVVGALSATDAESDDLTYALEDDADGLFTLVTENGETRLVLNGALDYETATSHQVAVKVSDGDNVVTQTLTVNVADVDENAAPTDIAISNTVMKESARTGFEVGVLSATDPEGDAITWSLDSTLGDNGDYFNLRTNDDGTVSVVLKNPLNHEATNGGVYELAVTATDSHGNATTQSIEITAEDDPLKFSGAPTGKNYTAVVENLKAGQEIGYLSAFDGDFDIASVTLTDDADGAFKIKSRTVDGVTRYYLATAGTLDREAADSHTVTFEATDTDGNTYQKTLDVKVLDAAETGDSARGRITIDAATALAASNGGVNWNSYVTDYHDKLSSWLPTFLPEGSGWSQSNPASEFVFSNGQSYLSMRGADLVYNWTDPVTGEDAHVVSGTVTDLVFGDGTSNGVTEAEVSISGLDLANDSTPLNRIYGDVNVLASAFMHGLDAGYPAEIEYVKALLVSYAQTFEGSAKADTYSGTIFNDIVRGNAGADTIKAGAGNDRILGGAGADDLYGNTGADTFLFKAVADSRKGAFDTIFDFNGKQDDLINLSAIDANTKKAGDQAFTFIGSQDFHHKAGELHFEKIKSDTVIEGDVNGDGKADFTLHLHDVMNLKADYFAL